MHYTECHCWILLCAGKSIIVYVIAVIVYLFLFDQYGVLILYQYSELNAILYPYAFFYHSQ
jgi:hypothetical protein